MSETSLAAAGRNVITIRAEPNNINGRDMAGEPALYIPLQIQLLPAGDQKNVEYTLIQLAGKLQSQPLGEFATFHMGPLAEPSNPSPFFRQQDAVVPLSRRQIKRLEDARAGKDAHLQLSLSGLLWFPTAPRFELSRPQGNLDLTIPRSHWLDRVLLPWNLLTTKIIEINFPQATSGESLRSSYSRVEEAERHFANGQYKETLTTLRLGFESLAQNLGFEAVGKDFFESLFASAHPEKREKARDALNGIYRLLHLGPHEHATNPTQNNQPVLTRQDARFALTLAYAVLEYIASAT